MAARNENDLVDSLYEAALGQQSWADATSDMVSVLGGETLILSVVDPRSLAVEVVGYQGLTTDNVQEYLQLAHHDPWLARATGRGLFNTAVIGTEIVQEKELINSYMYSEFLRPRTGVHHLLGSVLGLHDGRVGIVGTHRPRDARDFDRREARRLDRLLPHLRRALEIRGKLEHAERASRSAYSVLDQLSLGVLVLGATGKLLHANSAADVLLRAEDGLKHAPSGLRAANHEDNKRLQTLIAGFRQGPANESSAGAHVRIRRPSGKQAYAMMLAPAASSIRGAGKASPAILVFISDPEDKIVSDVTILRDLFGFSPAEGRLVLALLSGLSLPDFARTAGVTYNTVRTLLARAMARAEARTQLELVLRVASAVGGTSVRRSAQST
jgi:DNA-binding CsgD family transcriptional regulator